MIETVMLVPLRANSGRKVARPIWVELHRRLMQFGGGLSRASVVVGFWEDEGRVYQDASRQYIVSLTSWAQLSAWLDVVRWVREQFGQEAVYIEVAGVPEIFTD